MNIFKNNKGFTLVELLVAMGIFTLIITGVVWLLITAFRSRNIIWEQLDTQSEGRKIIQDFSNELRSANYSSIGAYPIEKAEDNQIIFYTNMDSDSYRERVRYFLDSGTLKKGIIKPIGSPMEYLSENEEVIDIVHNIANNGAGLFSYYDKSYEGEGEAMSDPVSINSIRMVKFNLMLEEDPTVSPAPLIIEGKVMVRNLKDN